MKSSKMLLAIAAVAASMSMTSCLSDIKAGYAGVKVDLYGSEKGVQQEVLGVGRYWIGINEELYKFPTYQVNYVYTRDENEGSKGNEEFTFQTKEGMVCSVDLGLSMHFEEQKIPLIYQTYHKGENEIRDIVVRKEIRDALNRVAGTLPVEAAYGEKKGFLIDTVESIVRKKLYPSGIIVDGLSLIGAVRIPESIEAALNEKVKMTQEAQRMQNSVAKEQAVADARKIKADGEAYYNKTVAASLTPELVELRRIEAWEKGGSKVPQTMAGQNTSLFLK